MSSAIEKIQCEKEETISKYSEKYRQQLDDFEYEYHLFLESLTKQTTNLHNHFLMEKINQWEKDSINKIQQTAEETRQLFDKYMSEHVKQIEIKLTKLIEELKDIQKENNMDEIILNKLKDKLKKLEEEFIKSSNISVQQDSSSFIEKLSIINSSQRFHIDINSKWNQNGITVAGGYEPGTGFNQLCYPYSIDVDDDQTIYVADTSNRRIVEWKNGATSGEVVAGRNGKGNRNDYFKKPVAVIFQKENDSLIISDRNSRRVIRCPRGNSSGSHGETIIANVDCYNLAMDNGGYIYVSDPNNHEVRRWKIGESNGTLVGGGNGQGNGLNQLNYPYYISVDQDQSVYISDQDNHRVIKWIKGAKEGIIVAGGHGQGNSLIQLSNPRGVFVDKLGTIYVADCGNDRVMRWLKEAKEGSVIVGGNGSGEQPNQLNDPVDLSFDRENNLYVVDYRNHRVQRFNIE